jgi:hypothetical protein
MEALSVKDQDLIAKNIVAACDNIEKLNKKAYNFLNTCSGFIAHYNLNGFKGYYEDNSLVADILENEVMNQFRNFALGERNYDYYMAKRDTYNKIIKGLERQTLNLWNS